MKGCTTMFTRSPRDPFCFSFMFTDEIQSNSAILDHKGNDHCANLNYVTLS